MRSYALAYLTVAPLYPVAMIDLAARTGYQHAGLRLEPAMPGGDFAPLVDSATLRRATLGAIRATGITVFDAEIVRLAPDFSAESHLPFLETCAELGAKAILVAESLRAASAAPTPAGRPARSHHAPGCHPACSA